MKFCPALVVTRKYRDRSMNNPSIATPASSGRTGFAGCGGKPEEKFTTTKTPRHQRTQRGHKGNAGCGLESNVRGVKIPVYMAVEHSMVPEI